MKSFSLFISKIQRPVFVALVACAAILVTFRVLGAPPAIMPDEHLYSMSSRHLQMGDAQIPNYLFYWVYSLTSLAGANFYVAAKVINIFFLAGTGFFTFLTASRFVSKDHAAWLALLIFVGPLSTYTSFFMPESMEFFLLSVAFWYLLKLDANSRWHSWTTLGTILGLAALAKPHALFIIPVIFVYASYISAAKQASRLRAILVNLSTFLLGAAVTKFGLGLAFAGLNGLTFFGATYSSSLSEFTSGAQGAASQTTPSAHATNAVVDSPLMKFLGVTASESLAHFAAAMFLYGLPIALIAALLPAALRNRKEQTELHKLVVLTSTALLVLIAVVAAFTAMLTVQGTDHSTRIMIRYYDFLMPVVLITGVALLSGKEKKSKILEVVSLAVVTSVILLVAIMNFSPYQPEFFDSPGLQATVNQSGFTWLFVAVSISVMATWLFSRRFAFRLYTFAYLPLLLIVGGFFAFSPISKSVQVNDYDRAAAFASQYLSADELKSLTVVAPQQNLMMRALFEIDNPGVDYKLVNPGDNFGFQFLAPGKQWVLEIGQTHTSEPASVRINGNGFTLLKVQTSPEYFFSSPLGSNFVSSASGLGVSEPSGAWTLGNATTLKFDQMLPANAKVRLTFEASASLSGKTSEISLGNSNLAIQAQTAPIDGVLEFHNAQPADTIVIKTEMPKTPKEMGLSQDTRPVGYKLIYIGLETK